MPPTATLSKPGVFNLPLSVYLADPAPAPSLSASIAHLLLERSPWHAYCNHPRLGAPEQVYRRDAAIGSVFHAEFLGAGADYVVINCDDFRTKAAKEARDQALEEGKTPIKAADMDTVEAMVEAASVQLDAHEIGNFTNRPGKAEQTLLWREENGVWCRACCDWLPDDDPFLYDLKTTTVAHPDVWQRRVFDTGYDLSAAHYLRGADMLAAHGGYPDATYRFVVVENKPPYALSVVDLSPGALHMAEKRRAAAVAMWGACLESNRWPGYAARVCTIDLPPYREAQQTEREISGRYDPTMLDELIEASAP